MSKIYQTLLFLLLSLNFQSWASTQEDLNIESGKIQPDVVSPIGKNKIRDHLQTLSRNITLTETNLSSTQKNISVIETEIKELEDLSEEHLKLKKRYSDFLSTAAKETVKNNKALKEIENYEAKVAPLNKDTLKSTQISEIQAAKDEKLKRIEWQKETEQKKNKITELLTGVEKNLQSIEGRKIPLKEQLNTWKNRLNEYQNTLTILNQKKQAAERFVASQNTANKNEK
ncbi:MAG: hypothetical protein EBR01_01305 [Proteobacteria bacterium]|nr:hypothetical protein [Pseudomonadota bacterium]